MSADENVAETDLTAQLLFTLLTGGTSLAISKTAVAPIERVKLLLQVQNVSIAADRRYKASTCPISRVANKERPRGGNLANVISFFPVHLINFAFHHKYRKFFFNGVDKENEAWKFLACSLAYGGAAGATSMAVVYPLDFARTRLAADIGKGPAREYKGLTDCMIKTLKSDGPTGLYRGFTVTVQGVIIHRAAYFGFFDAAKMQFDSGKPLTFQQTWLLAQVVTICAGFLSYPWDTVRRRMMMMPERKAEDVLYKGSLDCARKMIKHEGMGAFYKGTIANVLRGTGAALALTFYDIYGNFQFYDVYDNFQSSCRKEC